MAKEFTDFYKWNPVILRLELETAKAKRMAIFDRHNITDVIPFENIFKEYRLSIKTMEDYLSIGGTIPSSDQLYSIAQSVKDICNSTDVPVKENDIYLFGLFLSEPAALRINSTIDQIKADARKQFMKSKDSYYAYLYKRLYVLSNRVEMSFSFWWNINGKGRGFRSLHEKKLVSITMKTIEKDVRSRNTTYWNKEIYNELSAAPSPAPVRPKRIMP